MFYIDKYDIENLQYALDNNIIDLGELKTSGKKKNDDITDALCIGLSYFK